MPDASNMPSAIASRSSFEAGPSGPTVSYTCGLSAQLHAAPSAQLSGHSTMPCRQRYSADGERRAAVTYSRVFVVAKRRDILIYRLLIDEIHTIKKRHA